MSVTRIPAFWYVKKIVRVLTAQTGFSTQLKEHPWSDAVTANLESFAAAAQGKAPYLFTTEEMLHNIEVLEAITLSAEDRRTVSLD